MSGACGFPHGDLTNLVLTGFVTAVGINIVLGQLTNFTGYDAARDGGRVVILWSNVVAAVLLVVAAAWLMLRRTDRPPHVSRSRDPHRGGWPPDQMAPDRPLRRSGVTVNVA